MTMHSLRFSVKTLSPVVLSSMSNPTVMTETHLSFSGSIIRGVLASRFVKVQKLEDEAHNETFREFFYGGLKFLSANPEILKSRSFILPASLQRGKSGTQNENQIIDLLDTDKIPRGYKTFRGFGILKGETFHQLQVQKNIFMHMSRSGDEERLAGKSIDGQIYNYESIDAGQKFCGEILGEENILRQMLNALKIDDGQLIVYVGRSRFTQYGKCLMTFEGIEAVDAEKISGKVFLRLDTPLIPKTDCFLSAREILQREVADKLGGKVDKVFASCVEIENFVEPWSMKRPRVMALAAGTVFELNVADNFSTEKLFTGFGTRTEEGFGQIRIWTPSKNFTVGTLGNEEIPKPEKFSAKTIQRAKKILTAHLLEQVRLYAHEDAEKLRPQLRRGNMTHFFTRLDKILSNTVKENLRENFKAQIENNLRGGSQFEEHLNNLYMANQQKFSDVLTCRAEFPRTIQELFKASSLKDACDEFKFSDKDLSEDEFLSTYLTNYFRFARKIAADEGRQDRE